MEQSIQIKQLLEQALQILNMDSWTPEERIAHELYLLARRDYNSRLDQSYNKGYQEGYQIGYQQGLQEGLQESRQEVLHVTATALLQSHCTVDEVMQKLGMQRKDVEKIQEDLALSKTEN